MGKMFKRLSISIFLLLLMVPVLAIIAYASSNFQLPTIFDKYVVYKGGDSYLPDMDSYPFTSSDIYSIGFDTLYGKDKPFFEYYGEIPYVSYKDELTQFRVYNGTTIDGVERPYSVTELPEEAFYSPESGGFGMPTGLNSDTHEPHIWAMTKSHSLINFGKIGFWLLSVINWVASSCVSIAIFLKSVNMTDVVMLIDNSGEFTKILSTIFLIDYDTGNWSPMLIFATCCFVFGLVALAFRVVRGKSSLREVIGEVGILIASAAIASVFLIPNHPLKLSNAGLDIITALTNNLSTSSGTSSIFFYDTGDANLDNWYTQRGLINKIYIDNMINAQFGYTINDLDLNNSFGDVSKVDLAMSSAFGSDAVHMRICVTPSRAPLKRYVDNLGYYLWAVNSSVETSSTGGVYYELFGEKGIWTASSDRTLYVIDFLANLRALNDGVDGAVVSKIDNIMNSLAIPQYGMACTNMLGVIVLNAALVYALFMVTLFCVIGQLIVTLGSYCMVIVPSLLLFPRTRRTAKGMMWTYVLGFVRFLAGSAMFDIIIVIATYLASGGLMGSIVAAIIVFLIGRYCPVLIREINNGLTNVGRGKELRSMSRFYLRSDNFINKTNKRITDRFRRHRGDRQNTSVRGGLSRRATSTAGSATTTAGSAQTNQQNTNTTTNPSNPNPPGSGNSGAGSNGGTNTSGSGNQNASNSSAGNGSNNGSGANGGPNQNGQNGGQNGSANGGGAGNTNRSSQTNQNSDSSNPDDGSTDGNPNSGNNNSNNQPSQEGQGFANDGTNSPNNSDDDQGQNNNPNQSSQQTDTQNNYNHGVPNQDELNGGSDTSQSAVNDESSPQTQDTRFRLNLKNGQDD